MIFDITENKEQIREDTGKEQGEVTGDFKRMVWSRIGVYTGARDREREDPASCGLSLSLELYRDLAAMTAERLGDGGGAGRGDVWEG